MTGRMYKLIYFNIRGRGELSRLLFHAAGVPFEDVRLTHEEYQRRKSSLPFGQLPVLEIGGVPYAQSFGIAKFLAKEFGFYGKTDLERLKIDEIVFHTVDMFPLALRFYYEKNEAIKEYYRKIDVEMKLPRALGYLEKLLQKSRHGYFVGSEMTLADMAITDFCMVLEEYGVHEVAQCPMEVQKLIQRISSHPSLVQYFSERK